nr:hypothetical protein [uncultured Campylobacter sp.]
MGREWGPGCEVALLAETPPLASNSAQPPTTLYKGQATPALNLYYNCGAVSRTYSQDRRAASFNTMCRTA